MFQESVNTRQGLHHILLIAALVGFVQDLSSGGGAEAWSYGYSISPSRRWLEARQWCQQHFTDMVPLRNQEESDFLNNFLPFNKRYYWIGISKSEGGWVWTETDEKVPEYAQHWAPEEPDDIAAQDCVEIYIKRDNDTVLWNNESCRKKKGTVCYTASCKPDSCSANADCVETVGNYTCKCHPGFLGPRCEEAITCKPLQDLEQGDSECSQPYGSNRFSSSCRFYCDLGYDMVGESTLLCQASGLWNLPVPRCQLKKCSSDFFPVAGNVTCVDAVEPFSFGSQCNFTCQEGYSLTRDDTYTCLSSGQWSNPTPTCEVVQCNRLKTPPHASMQCQDPLGVPSYGSMCFVQCEEGFDLIGGNMTKCSAQGNWSHELPVCQAKRCPTLSSPSHGSLVCSGPHGEFSFASLCTKTCDEGFLLNGTNSTECTSEGVWSADIPQCLGKSCPTLRSPSHGSLVCSGPHGEFSFASQCTSTCKEGFIMNGTADTECTSLGMWSTDIPRCLAKSCPTLSSPSHGSLVCSGPHGEFSFASQCTSTCEEGFVMNGTADIECTSLGTWSTDIPRCLAKSCPTLSSPSHGSLVCSGPHGEFSFASQCTSTCEEGFVMNGTADTECTSLGMWSTDIPRCLAKRCPTLSSPSHGSLVCSGPHGEFSFASLCTKTCDEGFLLNGTNSTECTSEGVWSADIPQCLAKSCPTLSSPSHGSLVCSGPHGELSFASQCTSTCEEGFVMNGTADTECTSLGTWSTDIPRCLAKSCPTLSSPSHGSLDCSGPHGEFRFASQCTSTCKDGFVMNGTADTECTSLGTWSTDIPRCLAKRCPTLSSPSHGSLVCSGPHGEFSFASQCTSTCEEGFVMNGTVDTECTSLGMWSSELPHCLAQRCPLLDKAPHHGRMNCSHPYSPFSYGSHCDFECNEGFWLRGTPTTTCNDSGHWSQDRPSCQPLQCEAIPALSGSLSMNCSHPLRNFSFGSQCFFDCEEGFSLNGTEVLFCSSSGIWNDSLPNCIGDMPLGADMLLSSGLGIAYVVGPLVLVVLAVMLIVVYVKFRKRGDNMMSEAPAWGDRENPAFDFDS
ncbi:P-selectin isoform X2 [Eleginops maclovinus]|uniref:P-selectin isoform X2 n=1 Tax=Eleginops maclovinus TaxID=56733 RepID=UPI003080025E